MCNAKTAFYCCGCLWHLWHSITVDVFGEHFNTEDVYGEHSMTVNFYGERYTIVNVYLS
jgi:hypothetical protein